MPIVRMLTIGVLTIGVLTIGVLTIGVLTIRPDRLELAAVVAGQSIGSSLPQWLPVNRSARASKGCNFLE